MNTYLYLFRKAWAFMQGMRGTFVMVFIIGIIGQLAALAKPYVNSKFFNAIQLGGDNMWQNIFTILGALAILHIIYVVAWYCSTYLGNKVSIYIKKNAIIKYYAILYSLNMNYLVNNHSGDILSRIRQSADGVANFASRQATIIRYVVQFFGPVMMLFIFSWQIALISLALALLIILGMNFFDWRRVSYIKKTNYTVHGFNSSLLDAVSNIKTIKIFKKVNQTMNSLESKYKPVAEKDTKLLLLGHYKWSFFDIGSLFILVNGVILLYVYMTWKSGKAILIGNVFAVYEYILNLQDFLVGYGNEYQSLVQMKTDYEEINPVLKEVRPDIKYRHVHNFKNLEISNVNFKYPEKKESQLKNVSFRIKRGDKIAFVGESGSGKSTMLGLLAGCLDWQDGCVNINGKKSQIGSLSDYITFVPQDPEIFAESILYNITFGDKIPNTKIQEAIKISRFDEVMQRAKITLQNSAAEKGLNLSGGEKQRLALTRGVLAMENADIILLDEPTSSVDVYNENLIYDAIFHKFKKSTIISSVHKLNIIDKFDYIYVFKNGKIVESGTFKELVNQTGCFAKMMKKYKNKM